MELPKQGCDFEQHKKQGEFITSDCHSTPLKDSNISIGKRVSFVVNDQNGHKSAEKEEIDDADQPPPLQEVSSLIPHIDTEPVLLPNLEFVPSVFKVQ